MFVVIPDTFETTAAAAFSPSATVTCFLKLAGDTFADLETWPDSGSSSTSKPVGPKHAGFKKRINKQIKQ